MRHCEETSNGRCTPCAYNSDYCPKQKPVAPTRPSIEQQLELALEEIRAGHPMSATAHIEEAKAMLGATT
jgi:hypothetical protein